VTATISGEFNPVELGALGQRIHSTAWAEDLEVEVGFKGENLTATVLEDLLR
jgi:hypothetical protein